MKNIAAVGVLERIRRLAPQGAVPPYRTVEEWREWELAEGRKRSEGGEQPKHQVGGGKKHELSLFHTYTGPRADEGKSGCEPYS
ncbi:hypothetical protein UQ11_27015 [Escherichia coli]|nr:hypothetical protein UQ11_27015 [Escherichia coli]